MRLGGSTTTSHAERGQSRRLGGRLGSKDAVQILGKRCGTSIITGVVGIRVTLTSTISKITRLGGRMGITIVGIVGTITAMGGSECADGYTWSLALRISAEGISGFRLGIRTSTSCAVVITIGGATLMGRRFGSWDDSSIASGSSSLATRGRLEGRLGMGMRRSSVGRRRVLVELGRISNNSASCGTISDRVVGAKSVGTITRS